VPPESGRGRPSLRKRSLGPLTVVNLSPPQAINRRTCRSLAHLWLIMERDLSQLNRNPQREGGTPKAHINDSSRLGALRVAGRLRGPNRVGNLVMPGLLRRASGWPLCARIIPEVKSLGRTSQTFRERSDGLWMGSQKRGSPPGWLIHNG
jgi:hypothetical protein